MIGIVDVSTLRTNDCCREDLDSHLENTQSELDQLRDVLNGCGTLDANALLGVKLFQYFFKKYIIFKSERLKAFQ